MFSVRRFKIPPQGFLMNPEFCQEGEGSSEGEMLVNSVFHSVLSLLAAAASDRT